MKSTTITEVMFFLLILTSNFALLSASVCTETAKPCNQNADCCDGCCFEELCIKSEKCPKDPCSAHECPPSTACHLQKVHCVRSPCPPVPTCQPLGPA